ncbi:hypothetical protein Ddc_22353 [Ditylenchus destructor]|nr:hypothetical protein Ddc_22353 [Ditylenchus destructor]
MHSDTLTQKSMVYLINIHGGAFIVGSARMVNQDQIEHCLERGWIMVVPNHRLCPGVDLLEGPLPIAETFYRGFTIRVLRKRSPRTVHQILR